MEWIWRGYNILASCRNTGMSAGAIPWTAIRLYAMDEMYDADDKDMFISCVMSMDADYLKALDDAKPKKNKTG